MELNPGASLVVGSAAEAHVKLKDPGIEVSINKPMGGPPIVGAMITGQIDAAANLVTIEGMNANLKKPGVVMYIAINGQNKKYQMEQFVVRKGHPARSIRDLKGARILSASRGTFSSASRTRVAPRKRLGRSIPVWITTGCFSRSPRVMSRATFWGPT